MLVLTFGVPLEIKRRSRNGSPTSGVSYGSNKCYSHPDLNLLSVFSF